MYYNDLNDNELLYLVSDNNSEGYYFIYEKYKPIILSVAKQKFRLLNNCIYDIDDLIQSGYIGLQKAIDNFNKEKDVLFYTFAVFCINREISRSVFLSNNKYYRTSAYDYSINDNIKYLRIESFDSEDNINTRLLEERIYKFSLDLEFDDNCVFLLRMNGFSYIEISELLEVSIKRVDYILQKCKLKLKKYLFM